MAKLLKEISDDANFIKSHTLQPQWYKVLKIFILLGFLFGYGYFFGWIEMLIFLVVFLSLSLLVHLVYRVKTNKWRQSWLDFIVDETQGKPKSIGKYYYFAVIFNFLLALVVSQIVI